MLNKPIDFLPNNLEENKNEEMFKANDLKNLNFSDEVVKKFPHIKRVVGVLDSSDEEFVMTRLDELNKEGLEKKKGELEKSEKEVELINFAKKAADEILSDFGGDNLYDISLDRIHLFKENKKICGRWSYEENYIYLFRQKNAVKFVINAFHELAHSKSYVAMQLLRDEGKKDVSIYRSGLIVFSRDGEDNKYLDIVNEIMIYELEKIFFDKYIRNNTSFLEKDIDGEVLSAKRGVERKYVGVGANASLEEIIETFSKKVFEKISGQPKFSEYKNSEDIINLLIRSAISGDVLKLGRLIKEVNGSIK